MRQLIRIIYNTLFYRNIIFRYPPAFEYFMWAKKIHVLEARRTSFRLSNIHILSLLIKANEKQGR